MLSYRVIGLIALVVGIILLLFGINATHTTAEHVVEGTTGKYTSGTMGYIIGGIILLIAGVFLTFRKPSNM